MPLEYSFEVIHDFGLLWKQSLLMSTGIPIKNGQVNDLLAAILLPSEIAAIKIEFHT